MIRYIYVNPNQQPKMIKKLFLFAALGAVALPGVSKDRITVNPKATNQDAIMHVWSWSFPEISRSMREIADAGFTMIQTSPVQPHYAPKGSLKKIFDPNVVEGNWYYYYQPTDWKVGNQILGTKEQMQEMLDSAAKYNIKVLVDVLPNHTAFDIDAVSEDFYKAVGGRDKMFHSNGLKPISDYTDRTECTLEGVGGLPDVNTENPDFQKYYMQFVNELLRMGVRGFRYDTAKHIGVHSDPKDTGVKENDFWDVALGRKAVKGVRLALPEDSLFIYGEVLQDKNVPETEYADYMNQTASSYGHVLREALDKHSALGIDLKDFRHDAAPEYLTTWVESHDTYCNGNESAHLTDNQIREGWVFLTARQNGTPLFFSRPAGSTRQNYYGDNILGARGNDGFKDPEVAAVNKFRQAMKGETEDLQFSDNGQVWLVNRGNKGAAVVNVGTFANFVNLPTGLPDGTYRDVVYGKEFKVIKGRLTGALAPERSYILVKK